MLGLVGGAPAQGWGELSRSLFASVLQAASIKSRQQLTLQGYYTAIRFAVDTQRRYIKGLDGRSRAKRETPSAARPKSHQHRLRKTRSRGAGAVARRRATKKKENHTQSQHAARLPTRTRALLVWETTGRRTCRGVLPRPAPPRRRGESWGLAFYSRGPRRVAARRFGHVREPRGAGLEGCPRRDSAREELVALRLEPEAVAHPPGRHRGLVRLPRADAGVQRRRQAPHHR